MQICAKFSSFSFFSLRCIVKTLSTKLILETLHISLPISSIQYNLFFHETRAFFTIIFFISLGLKIYSKGTKKPLLTRKNENINFKNTFAFFPAFNYSVYQNLKLRKICMILKDSKILWYYKNQSFFVKNRRQ